MSATGSPKVAPARVATVPSPTTASPEGIVGQPYPIRIPDGECLALCTGYFWDRKSRRFGERIYLDFRVFDGEYAGKKLQMFLKPSSSYSSKFYRSWSIAHDGPPRSRNTKMSPKIFIDKLFRVRTSTVRPRHQITGPDGRQRPGEPQPEHLWYSKVDCLLSLEVTNEVTNSPVVALQPKPNSATPVVVTEISPNPFSHREMDGGGYGRRTLDSGYWVRKAGFARWGGQSDNAPNPVGGEENLAAGRTPPTHQVELERLRLEAEILGRTERARQAEELRRELNAGRGPERRSRASMKP